MIESAEHEAGSSLPSGATVTIFFSDIRGFTDFTSKFGDQAAFRMLQEHNTLVRKQIELFGGRVVKTQGDNFMVYFPTARAAILCAVAIQRAMAPEVSQSPPGSRMAIGIGINTGEPIHDDGDFFGIAVNLAARICAEAGPAEVLISETSRHVAGRIDGINFVDRGSRELKGFPEPQRLYEVSWTPLETRAAVAARVTPASASLRAEFEALVERFGRLGGALVAAGRAMREGVAGPPATAPAELATLRIAFVAFRARLMEQAAEFGLATQTLEAMGSLDELEPLLAAVIETEATSRAPETERLSTEDQRSRQAALEAAVQRALGVLNRVLMITHRDDSAFAPLLECQAKASELRLTLSRVIAQSLDYSAQRVDEAMLPFADLLTLVVGQENVDDDRWAQLEAAVVRTFGRPLVVAATRGRMQIGGAEPRAARAEPSVPAAPPSPPAAPVPPAPPAADPTPVADPRPAAPAREPAHGGDYATVSAAATAPPPIDPRADGVAWWVAARDAWRAWRSSGMAMAHALRAELGKHPYLLSVPIRESARHGDGRVAAGYFLLLEHVENLSPAFMRGVVEQAVERTGSTDPGVLEPVLYELLVNKGRLRQTFPDFVRDVMIAAVPSPGVWATAGIVEHDGATLIVSRPGGVIGEAAEQTKQLTEIQDRIPPHTFVYRLAPLTARFFYIRRGELKELRDVDIKLTVDGQPSDVAWLLVVRMDNLMQPPRRLTAAGTPLPDMGKTFAGVWIGVYNADPVSERHHELAVSVRTKVQTTVEASRRSSFSGPARRS